LAVSQSVLVEEGKKKIEITVENLGDTWARWKTEFPEQRYAAFYASFPPKGKRSYTWQELGDHYLQLSKAAFESSPEINALAGAVKGSTEAEIISDSFDAIVGKIRYHADEQGRFVFFPRKAATILKNGYGDCKEISTLLKTLLQEKKKSQILG
jgi:transglutaminase-like putative cysteine protease